MEKFIDLHSKLTYMFVYKYKVAPDKAVNKAYEKVRDLIGILLFFPLFGLLIFINQMFWHFTVDFLFVSPFVSLFLFAVYYVGKRFIKPRLVSIDIKKYDKEFMRKSLKLYYKTMIGIGLYCGLMYVVLRLSFIHLFVK